MIDPICRVWHIVLLITIICWSCAVSFGQPVRTERAYRAADGTFDQPWRWQDLRVPLETVKINPTGNPPTFDNITGLNVGAYRFSGTARNECFFSAQLPHGIARGYPLHPHIHYLVETDIAANATITIGLEYFIAGTLGQIATTTTITASISGVSSYTHLLADLPAIPLPTSGGIDSAMLVCRLYRPGNTDSSNAVLVVLEFDLHYRESAVGSYNERGDYP